MTMLERLYAKTEFAYILDLILHQRQTNTMHAVRPRNAYVTDSQHMTEELEHGGMFP